MINCKQASLMISQGLDRPLGLGERLRLRCHLLICLGCRRTRAQLLFLRAALGRHPFRP